MADHRGRPQPARQRGGRPKIAEHLAGHPDELRVLELAHHFGVTEAYFLGQPAPPEFHTHYADDGTTVTGYTLVERASPWTDQQRARMLALARYRGDVHRCGVHDSIRSNEDNVFVPDEDVCDLCAALDRHERVVKAKDDKFRKQLGDDPDPKIPHPSDGRRLFLRPATEKELIERARRAEAETRKR